MSDQIVGLINPGMSLIFAIGGFALWLRDRRQTYVLGYVFAALTIGLSFAINHYSPTPDAKSVQIVVSALSITAIISLAWSMCRRMRQPVPMWLWIAGGLGTVGIVYLSDHAQDVSASLFAVNAYCGVVMVMGAQLMAMRKSSKLVDRMLVVVFSVVAVQFFVRPVAVILMSGAISTGEYRDSAGHAILIVTAAILTLALTGSILAATISDQIKAVEDSARIDGLSGLIMRNAFEVDARAMIEAARAAGKPVSMVIADIDHFKQVNDDWGHPVGDKVIGSFGQAVAGTIRPSDLAGRVGGEEFCILVWNCSSTAAGNLAERLRNALINLSFEGIPDGNRPTASFGVAQWGAGDAYSDVYARADAALYRAKREGRNRVVIDGAASVEAPVRVAPAQPSLLPTSTGAVTATAAARVVSLSNRQSQKRGTATA